MNKKIITFIKIFVTIVFIIVIVSKISIIETVRVLSSTNIFYIPVVFLIYILSLYVTSANLKILFNSFYSAPISALIFFKFFLISSAIGSLMPGKLDNFIFINYLKKYINLGSCFAVSMTYTILTIGIHIIIGIFGIIYIFHETIDLKNLILFISLFLVSIIFIYYILKLKFSHSKNISDFISAIRLILQRKNAIINSIVLIMVKNLLNSLNSLLIFNTLGYGVDFYIIFLINSIITVVTTIPITINGFGLREGSAIYLYSFFDISTEVIVSALIISYFVIYITSIIVFLINYKYIINVNNE